MGDGNCGILKVAPGQSWILILVASKQRHLFKLFRSGRSLVFVSLVGNQVAIELLGQLNGKFSSCLRSLSHQPSILNFGDDFHCVV